MAVKSTISQAWVTCDHSGCTRKSERVNGNEAAAIALARQAGWDVGNLGLVAKCPTHKQH